MLKLYMGSANWITNPGNIAKNWDSGGGVGGCET